MCIRRGTIVIKAFFMVILNTSTTTSTSVGNGEAQKGKVQVSECDNDNEKMIMSNKMIMSGSKAFLLSCDVGTTPGNIGGQYRCW